MNDMALAIEAKSARKVKSDHLNGLRQLRQDQPRVRERILVCLEAKAYKTEDGIWVLPAREFCARLKAGDLF